MEHSASVQWQGFCPICEKDTTFSSPTSWYRDYLTCGICGSIPRERALMLVLRREAPYWPALAIHESSPADRGASRAIRSGCAHYVASQFFPGRPPGSTVGAFRCEDLERQTFGDDEFDIVITQDVMEHVFHPDRAYAEIFRTLRPGGLYVHTVPIFKQRTVTGRRARLVSGTIVHDEPAEYHGNPIDEAGSLVTHHYGYDLHGLIAQWSGFDVEITRFHDRTHGIVAEMTEVVVCRKPGSKR